MKMILLLILMLAFPTAHARDLELRGRLLLQDTEFGWDENTPDQHSKLKSGYTIGIAMFDNGAVAEKLYVFAQNNRENDGSIGGFTLYSFPNGDSLLMEFTASWDDAGLKITYPSIIEGTGRFKGATGGGSGSGIAGPWYETIMADIVLKLNLEGS